MLSALGTDTAVRRVEAVAAPDPQHGGRIGSVLRRIGPTGPSAAAPAPTIFVSIE